MKYQQHVLEIRCYVRVSISTVEVGRRTSLLPLMVLIVNGQQPIEARDKAR